MLAAHVNDAMKSRVLIIEDEAAIREMLGYTLMREGFECEEAADVEQARPMLARRKPDLILLDWMLPGVSGVDYARRVRSDPDTRDIPIIMLTARSEEADKVRALDTGADDYITKPFSMRELMARIRALMRRSYRAGPTESTLKFGSIVMDLESHIVSDQGREIRLTAKEFMLLQYLLEHRGRVLSRDLLLGDVWGYRYTGGTRTVDVHVRRLREKLPVLVDALVTVKQFGYKLASDEAR